MMSLKFGDKVKVKAEVEWALPKGVDINREFEVIKLNLGNGRWNGKEYESDMSVFLPMPEGDMNYFDGQICICGWWVFESHLVKV